MTSSILTLVIGQLLSVVYNDYDTSYLVDIHIGCHSFFICEKNVMEIID